MISPELVDLRAPVPVSPAWLNYAYSVFGAP
jgi:hypothetical protein